MMLDGLSVDSALSKILADLRKETAPSGTAAAAVENMCAVAPDDVHATRTELGVYEFNEEARIFWESMGFATLFRRMCRHDVS
jgi:hypothetical protein